MNQRDDQDRREHRRRRPYSPPSIIESVTFETLAVACGKVNPDVAECNPVFGGSAQNS